MLEIHLGSSYDFFNSSKFLSVRQTLGFVALGLKNFCLKAKENNTSPDTKLKGIVYYFNANSLNQFGFKTRPLKFYECILFSLNYLELCLLYSIVKKRFSLIPLTTVKVAYSTAGEIMKFYPTYEKYSELLTNSSKPTPSVNEDKEYLQRLPSKSIAA
ncbi:MAG: hypothetical protein SFU91_02145 [Chloroherpetonaceae bacterium]|nr:hypothetical protein [Chloroherpetonaceae bacterium]